MAVTHVNPTTGAFGHWGLRGAPKWVAVTHVTLPLGPSATGTFGGAPYGATNHVRGVPKWVALTNAIAATGTFGGAPYGATHR
eukprot:3433770-Pyramimonas_sp.AAC.1